jgi:hypothetical protein
MTITEDGLIRYKGFLISRIHPRAFKYAGDWEVWPEGKEEESELFESMTLEDVENIIDTLVN